jgi:putative transposase
MVSKEALAARRAASRCSSRQKTLSGISAESISLAEVTRDHRQGWAERRRENGAMEDASSLHQCRIDLLRLLLRLSPSVLSIARRHFSTMGKRTKPRQRELVFHSRGGKRPGAGRPPRGERAGVSHATRDALNGREPVLVTLKARAGLVRLRSRRVLARILPSLVAARERHLRLVHFSVQRDHFHLVVEADSQGALARGIQGLSVRIARKLNALMGRRGKVFADRYHAHVLRTPRQVRNALAYVLGNARKHGERLPARGIDRSRPPQRSKDGTARSSRLPTGSRARPRP